MTSAQVVETSVTNNSSFQNYTHPDDHTIRTTSGYVGTPLEGKVTLADGIQIWTVPATGIYVIEVSGASGANGTNSTEDSVSWRLGGLGAKKKRNF